MNTQSIHIPIFADYTAEFAVDRNSLETCTFEMLQKEQISSVVNSYLARWLKPQDGESWQDICDCAQDAGLPARLYEQISIACFPEAPVEITSPSAGVFVAAIDEVQLTFRVSRSDFETITLQNGKKPQPTRMHNFLLKAVDKSEDFLRLNGTYWSLRAQVYTAIAEQMEVAVDHSAKKFFKAQKR